MVKPCLGVIRRVIRSDAITQPILKAVALAGQLILVGCCRGWHPAQTATCSNAWHRSVMAEADVRWLQRPDSYGRALAILSRALAIANQPRCSIICSASAV